MVAGATCLAIVENDSIINQSEKVAFVAVENSGRTESRGIKRLDMVIAELS